MIKEVITIVLLGICIGVNSQNIKKSFEPYTAKNGETFKVGDKIIIGSPADFSNKYLYYTYFRDLSEKLTANHGYVILNDKKIEVDIRYDTRTIKLFKIYEDYGTCAVFDKLLNEMINIDKGLETGELVTKKNKKHLDAIYNNSINLNDSIAYIEYLNLINTITIENTKEYLYLFDNNIYNQIREDEFEFHEKILETKNFLKNEIEKKENNDTFKIFLKIEIGNYDFDKNGFPIKWGIKNGIQILDDLWEFFTPKDINNNGIKLTDLRLQFTNTEDFIFLSLNKEKANYLIKHRKDESGNIDRYIYMYAHFIINKVVENVNESLIKFKYDFIEEEAHLKCDLIKICFFEDKKGYNWLNNIE